MPFIFHSSKQSIFHKDRQADLTEEELEKIKTIARKSLRANLNYKVNVNLCRQHPFRGSCIDAAQQIQETQADRQAAQKEQLLIKNQGIGKVYYQNFNALNEFKKNIQNVSNGKQREAIKDSSELLVFSPSNCQQAPERIHNNKNIKKTGQMNVRWSPSKEFKSSNSFGVEQGFKNKASRMNYQINDTPGPGYYDTSDINQKSASSFIMSRKCHRALQKEPSQSFDDLISEYPKKTDQLLCSYKSQSSAAFKEPVSKKKKKDSLIKLVLSQRRREKQDPNQKQIKEPSTEETDQEYERVQQKTPSPFAYQAKDHFAELKKVALSKKQCAPKRQYLLPKQVLSSFCQESQKQNCLIKGSLTQQMRSKFQKFQEKLCSSIFQSQVPRQLKFDTQKLCQQEFYYSPKNSLSDQVRKLIVSRSNQFNFGSSLQRFQLDGGSSADDPFKYSLSKQQSHFKKAHNNSPEFKTSSSKSRQVLKKTENKSVSPCEYNPDLFSVSKNLQKQFFKKLIRQKYKDEVGKLREKKQYMQTPLIQKTKGIIDAAPLQKSKSEIDLNRYANCQRQKRWKKHENISFGSDKKQPLNRELKGRKQLQIYYDSGPKWNVPSFNLQYGFELNA